MKVVLFCGGLGLRMRDVSQKLPKPMIPVGDTPILLHVMKYYAYHGHTDFILCLGYKGRVIKDYLLRNHDDVFLKNFSFIDDVKLEGARPHGTQDWRIAFADTGLHTNIGGRLRAVRNLVSDDEVFLANYSDVLTDAPLPEMISNLVGGEQVASFVSVRPNYSFHVVSYGDGAVVRDIQALERSDIWINGGYFVLRSDIFSYLHEREELVEEPFRRLIAKQALLAYRHEGFWAPMDTFKDRQNLESLASSGRPPWTLWEPSASESASLVTASGVPVPAA